MNEQYDFFGISKGREITGSLICKDWAYNVFAVAESRGKVSVSPVAINVEARDVAEKVLDRFRKGDVNRLSLVPYDNCLNTDYHRGIHLCPASGRREFQVGQVSDEELSEIAEQILELRKQRLASSLKSLRALVE